MHENNLCVHRHGCVTVVALQSLNFTLQTQLNESRRELDDLQQENVRLRKAMEDKDSDLKQHKELYEFENSRLRLGKSILLDCCFFKSCLYLERKFILYCCFGYFYFITL